MSNAIDSYWDTYLNAVDDEARKVFKAEILPFLRRNSLSLTTGMGIWSIWDPATPTGEDPQAIMNTPEGKEIAAIMDEEVPGLPGNNFGSMMPDYTPGWRGKHEQAS